MPRGVDVGILEHRMAEAAYRPIGRGFGLGENVDEFALRWRSECPQSHALERLHHRRKVDRISHHGMADSERARREGRIAHENHDIVHEFDASRAGGDA
jgi:hypothetical protein